MRIRGFSLIEFLIAIIIISICVLSVSMMFHEALRGSPAVKSMTIASALAERIMENVTAYGFNATGYSGNFSEYNYTVSVYNVSSSDLDTLANASSDFRHITVRLSYPATGGRVTNITVDSLVTSHLN